MNTGFSSLEEVPGEVVALAVLLVAAAAGLTWKVRAGWRSDWWRPIEDGISMLLMLTMLSASLMQVAVRYFLSDYVSFPWTDELSAPRHDLGRFLGAAMLQRSDDHISMGVLHDLMPRSVQTAMQLFADLVVLAVMAPMVWLGWRNAEGLEIISTSALGVPVAVFAFAVPVTGALMILHTIVLIWRRLRGETISSQFEPGI